MYMRAHICGDVIGGAYNTHLLCIECMADVVTRLYFILQVFVGDFKFSTHKLVIHLNEENNNLRF